MVILISACMTRSFQIRLPYLITMLRTVSSNCHISNQTNIARKPSDELALTASATKIFIQHLLTYLQFRIQVCFSATSSAAKLVFLRLLLSLTSDLLDIITWPRQGHGKPASQISRSDSAVISSQVTVQTYTVCLFELRFYIPLDTNDHFSRTTWVSRQQKG